MRLMSHLSGAFGGRAQAFYRTVATGAATAVLTLLSGQSYGELGSNAFLLMAGLCAIAVPLARGLPRSRAGQRS